MTKFIDRFKQYGDYSLRGMRKTAMSLLPKDRSEQDALHDELNRGKDALEDENLLNMYLFSYGKMHKFKLVKAFIKLLEKVDFHKEEIEIYDWGCGQGLATVCLLDCLDYLEIKPIINKIYLVDRSFAATNRASEVIECIMPDCHVETVVNDLNYLTKEDFQVSNIKKIHLFSNILDVESYDLTIFTKLFQHVCTGDNYIVCVGPYYNRERIEEFFAYIEPDEFYFNLDYVCGEWIKDWSGLFRVCYKRYERVSNPDVFSPITINKENFPNGIDLWVSSAITSQQTGNTVYWATIDQFKDRALLYLAYSVYEGLTEVTVDTVLPRLMTGEFEITKARDIKTNRYLIVNGEQVYMITRIRNVSHAGWKCTQGKSSCAQRDKRTSKPSAFTTFTINRENFPNGIDLWVSSAITSKQTGNIVYWATIDQFEDGVLLYLAHSVYDGLDEVNTETVLPRLMTGEYEIVEARDINTNEPLTIQDGKQVYMIQKIRNVLHADWKCTQSPYCEPSNDGLPF